MYKIAILTLFIILAITIDATRGCQPDCDTVDCDPIKCAPGYISVKPPCECCNECQKVEKLPPCQQEKEVGPCKASIPRYFYNQTTGECERFIFGGCHGNDNNFETKGDCEKACFKKDVQPCEQEKKVGPCKAAIPRYFYNQETGKCERFIYGGCQGNGNNFEKKIECEKLCEDVPSCLLKKNVGKCFGAFPRYFYNQETGNCERFIYGGCQGNRNNFKTKDECENVCKVSKNCPRYDRSGEECKIIIDCIRGYIPVKSSKFGCCNKCEPEEISKGCPLYDCSGKGCQAIDCIRGFIPAKTSNNKCGCCNTCKPEEISKGCPKYNCSGEECPLLNCEAGSVPVKTSEGGCCDKCEPEECAD